MYNGVPNNVNFYEVYGFGTTLLNPKSDNLAIPCFNSILAGLISRWMILLLYNYLYPSII